MFLDRKLLAQRKKVSKMTLRTCFDTNQSIADEFNKYFVNVGPDLSDKIEYKGKKVVEHFLTAPITSKFKFEIITDKEILEVIGSLTPKESSGYDKLSSKMLIQLSPILHSALDH